MTLFQVSRVLVFADGTVHRVPIRTFEEQSEAEAFSKLSQGALERLVLSTLIDDANAALAKPSTADRLVASLGIKQIHTAVLPVEVDAKPKEPSLIQVPRLAVGRH